MGTHVLAIDQGTTSTRALVFDREARRVATEQVELPQHFPRPGWVEHDAEDIWRDTLATMRRAIERSGVGAHEIAAIGITNQRETTLVWDRDTGEPIHRAIVWQDRRTADLCRALKEGGNEAEVTRRTGLLLDPYFSGTKIAWLLDNVAGARARAEAGRLAFGTIDTFLLWRLTGGRVHATDVTNASRTLLWNLRDGRWDEEMCRLLGVPAAMLPEVQDNAHLYGTTARGLFDAELPIAGVAGDQQAALFGQACFDAGMAKSTYGTGCFLLLNTGGEAVASEHRLLTTAAWRQDGRTTFALEGSIFVAGAAVKWLRDGLGVIGQASDTEGLSRDLPADHGVYMVPAFTGLGAPHWDPDARAAVHGMTLATTPAHLARAALEAVAFQTHDLLRAMRDDGAAAPETLRIDGGMAANAWMCAFLADVAKTPVERPDDLEATARGAAFHAGLATGLWSGTADLARLWHADGRFEPTMPDGFREALLAGWQDAVARTLRR